MPRTELVKSEVQRLIHAAPFRPFSLNMENGDRVIIEHPENIAFDPSAGDAPRGDEFYVLTRTIRLFSTFSSVTSVAILDDGELEA